MSRYDKQITLKVLNVEKIPLCIISSQIAITLVLLYDHVPARPNYPWVITKSSRSHQEASCQTKVIFHHYFIEKSPRSPFESARSYPEVIKKTARSQQNINKSYIENQKKTKVVLKLLEVFWSHREVQVYPISQFLSQSKVEPISEVHHPGYLGKSINYNRRSHSFPTLVRGIPRSHLCTLSRIVCTVAHQSRTSWDVVTERAMHSS